MRLHFLSMSLGISAAMVSISVYGQQIPRVWDDAMLERWSLPLAGLNVRPSHMTAKDYYALPVENLRTYPVYYPGREPEGYWDMLQRVGPKPLIEPTWLKTDADWLEAGRRVFEELDHIPLRTLDSKLIAAARTRETYDAGHTAPLPDGTIFGVRWVPTSKGVALSFSNCANCHLAYLRTGTRVPGAPTAAGIGVLPVQLALAVHLRNRVPLVAVPLQMPDEPLRLWLYRGSAVPWLRSDPNEHLKTITSAEFRAQADAIAKAGAAIRWNGSLYYPAKIPDLNGIKNRKYLDATATHLHRGIGDLMRYAALVSSAEAVDFGPYHFLPDGAQRIPGRLPDEALYALARYLYALEPPPNPNQFDERSARGSVIFRRERCSGCHPPPYYTNNKLTLAIGFMPPKEHQDEVDVLQVSVGTDPGLALKTRKGTGYYKIPSLKGVWYRGHYLHDGSVTSLEEMFDPDRLNDTHVPGGWRPPGEKTRAIKGHEFGLNLKPAEREDLIAFLRTL